MAKKQVSNRLSHQQRYTDQCESLAEESLLRHLPHYNSENPGVVDFSHNDYLGLSRHPKTIQAAGQALEKWGTGATASRLLAGNLPLFTEFEQQIAAAKNPVSYTHLRAHETLR